MNIKKAFTLAEVLLVMAIIGILITLGLTTFKKYDKGIRYTYSNIFHSLDRAFYNATNFVDLPNPFDDGLENGEGGRRLCAMLTQFINPVDKNSCSADSTTVASDLGEDFSSVRPQFIASNGAVFYISKRLPESFTSADVVHHYFYLIFVDVNGSKKPNSMKYEEGNTSNNYHTTDPDIFAFAALDIGRICPLGPPEYDSRYMLTRVAYQDTGNSGENEDTVTIKYSKTSKPYYVSKAEAWGFYLTGDDGIANPVTQFIDENPLTYNDYIRNHINVNSMIYKFLNGATISASNVTSLKKNKPTDATNPEYGCVKVSDEECDVIIDRYVY